MGRREDRIHAITHEQAIVLREYQKRYNKPMRFVGELIEHFYYTPEKLEGWIEQLREEFWPEGIEEGV